MTRLLGIDLGTTTFKAVVYDETGAELAAARVPPPDAATEIAGLHVDYWPAEALWERLGELTRATLRQLPDSRVDALSIVEIGLVGLPLDANRRPLFDAVTWIEPDQALAAVFERSGLASKDVFQVTGNSLNPIYPPAWIAWLSKHAAGYAEGMQQWVYYGDYLAYRLTGELAVDYSMASQTLTLDQSTLAYSPQLLAALELDEDIFPTPRPAGTVLGGVTAAASAATGLPEGTPVVLGGADYVSGAYGAGFVDKGDVAIITGTWECIVVCSDRPHLNPALARVGAICDPHVAAGRWATRIENLIGSVTEWFRREIGSPAGALGDNGWLELVEAAETTPPGSGGVLFHPYLFGSYGPRVDELARGAFVGLRGTTTRDHLARALYEGLNFHTRSAIEAMTEASGEAPVRIVCMGGGAKNRFWMQNRADVLGRPIDVVASPDVTPRGAAMIAGTGVGVFDDFVQAAHRFAPARSTLEPNDGLVDFYTEIYETGFRPLCDALAPVHRSLVSTVGPVGVGELP